MRKNLTTILLITTFFGQPVLTFGEAPCFSYDPLRPLSKMIAGHYGRATYGPRGNVRLIAALNGFYQDDEIPPGTKICLPTTPEVDPTLQIQCYRVSSDQILSKLVAEIFGRSSYEPKGNLDITAKINLIQNPDLIYPNQKICAYIADVEKTPEPTQHLVPIAPISKKSSKKKEKKTPITKGKKSKTNSPETLSSDSTVPTSPEPPRSRAPLSVGIFIAGNADIYNFSNDTENYSGLSYSFPNWGIQTYARIPEKNLELAGSFQTRNVISPSRHNDSIMSLTALRDFELRIYKDNSFIKFGTTDTLFVDFNKSEYFLGKIPVVILGAGKRFQPVQNMNWSFEPSVSLGLRYLNQGTLNIIQGLGSQFELRNTFSKYLLSHWSLDMIWNLKYYVDLQPAIGHFGTRKDMKERRHILNVYIGPQVQYHF